MCSPQISNAGERIQNFPPSNRIGKLSALTPQIAPHPNPAKRWITLLTCRPKRKATIIISLFVSPCSRIETNYHVIIDYTCSGYESRSGPKSA
jgi:hypothetical protein